MAHHKALGKVLTALKHSTLLGRTDDRHVRELGVSLEIVIDTLDQRILWTYYHHIDLMLDYKRLDGIKIVSLDRYILAHL